MAIAALCFGCDTGGKINLIPVYPSDEPALLHDVGVDQIAVELYGADARDAAPVEFEILEDETLHFGDLSLGPWIIVVRGLDATGTEVVYGESKPFEIAKSASRDVRVFLGRARAFNSVALAPTDVAKEIAELIGHTATPFTGEDGAQRILIAGGNPLGDTASAEAYIVDPGEFTVTKLDAQMSKARNGHRAIAVEPPGRQALVVIADVGDGPIDSLEIFDTKDMTFRSVDVPCAPPVSAGIAPAFVDDGSGALVHSGRVILPGAELCVIDPYGEEEAESWPSPSGAAPVAPAIAAVNAAGQLVVVDGDGVVSVASAVEDDFDPIGRIGAGEGFRARIAPRVGGALTAVGASDRFAVIGGETPLDGTPESDWALIELTGFEVTHVYEGVGGDPPVEDPVLMDVSSAETSPVVDVVITGGGSAGARESAVLIGDAPDSEPLWYGSAGAHTPAMRAARLGHAVAVLDNRSAWVFGGTDGDEDAEIFELGDGAAPLGAETREFAARRPVLTAMTVLDETEAGDELATLIRDEAFLGALLLQENVTATLYMLNSADRGVSNDIALAGLPDTAGCQPMPVTWESEMIDGTTIGPTNGIDVPDNVTALEDGQNPVGEAVDAIDAWMNGMKVQSLGAESDADDGEGPVVLMDSGGDPGKCEWRQYLRVGFDGLGYEGPSKAEKDLTYPGVNVLILAVSGDDCSQGLYLNVNDSSNDFSDLPPGDELGETFCDDIEMDDYFGLPPDYLEGLDLDKVARGLVWDPRDLIVGIVRQTASPADPDAEKTSELPRRLRAGVDFLVTMGAEIVPMFVEDADDAAFEEQIGVLSDRIAKRNRDQVCIPENLVGSNDAPFDANVNVGMGVGGLYMPLDESDAVHAALLAAMREIVKDKCRVYRVVANRFEDGTVDARNERIVELDAWKIGTDTDRRAGCGRGWTVVIDSETLQPETGELFLRCVAD